jgi:molybdenum cofactor cytidylyltransferase
VSDNRSTPLAAVVLAAGLSSRMGQPKMVLPWGEDTVIGRVVRTLWAGGVQQVVVVTGGAHDAVEQALERLPANKEKQVVTVFNRNYSNGEMLISVRVGLHTLLESDCDAFLLALGDQPQIEANTVTTVIDAFRSSGAALVVPSFEMRRGHPWLVGRRLWPSLLSQQLPFTLRDFLNLHRDSIYYANVNTASVLADLDTPDDYRRQAP